MFDHLCKRLITYFAFALGMSICISTAAMSITYIIVILLSICTIKTPSDLKIPLKNYYIIACIVFYSMLIIGTIWSKTDISSKLNMLKKTIPYAISPLLFIALNTNDSAKRCLQGFLLGAMISCILSIISFSIKRPILHGITDNTWVVFHGHIIHSVFLAIAGLFFLYNAFGINKLSALQHNTYIACYLMCVINVIFIVSSRTGYILLLITHSGLWLLLLYKHYLQNNKQWIYMPLAIIAIIGSFFISPNIKYAVDRYNHDNLLYKHGYINTSIGLRNEFRKNSIKIFLTKPWFGYGTGSFSATYNTPQINKFTTNPHCDWLWIGVELGLMGIIGFFLLLSSCLFSLNTKTHYQAVGIFILIGYILSSLHNSLFIDNVTAMAFNCIMLSIYTYRTKLHGK
jgi:O-antigen ligase